MELGASVGAKTVYDTDFRLIGAPSINPYVKTITPWDYVEIHDNSTDLPTMIGKYETVLAGGAVGGMTRLDVPTIRFVDPDLANAGSHGVDQMNFPGQIAGVDDKTGAGARGSPSASMPPTSGYTHF